MCVKVLLWLVDLFPVLSFSLIRHHYSSWKQILSVARSPRLASVGGALVISERSNQSLNITTLLGKGCSTDDEAIFLLLVKKIRQSVWDEVLILSWCHLLLNVKYLPSKRFLGEFEQLRHSLPLGSYLQIASSCIGFYLTITVRRRWCCFSSAQFMPALIGRPSRLMARIFERTNTCCAVSPNARRRGPNSPYWHDEFDKSSYRPGRQLKRMWQGSLSPLSSCSASFRSHLSPLWISYF